MPRSSRSPGDSCDQPENVAHGPREARPRRWEQQPLPLRSLSKHRPSALSWKPAGATDAAPEVRETGQRLPAREWRSGRPFGTCFLSTCCVPGPGQSAGTMVLHQMAMLPAPVELTWGRQIVNEKARLSAVFVCRRPLLAGSRSSHSKQCLPLGPRTGVYP